jgi:hypothetical protein
MGLLENEKMFLLMGPIRRYALSSGLMTSSGFNAALTANTNPDGTINWQGLIAFLTALMPLIEALIAALGG